MDAGRITAGVSTSAAQAVHRAQAGRAYGPIRFADAVAQLAPAQPTQGPLTTDPRRSPDLERNLERLVAAKTDVSARAQTGVPTADPMSIYRHPADKNLAATGVAAGRMVDVKG
jgi:hypothetical protein